MTFDEGCKFINARLLFLREWKHNYLGAAYTTRLKQLVIDLEDLKQKVIQIIEQDEK